MADDDLAASSVVVPFRPPRRDGSAVYDRVAEVTGHVVGAAGPDAFVMLPDELDPDVARAAHAATVAEAVQTTVSVHQLSLHDFLR